MNLVALRGICPLYNPPAGDAQLVKAKILATYSPPLTTTEQKVLWSLSPNIRDLPPREVVAKKAAELEAEWLAQNIIDEKIDVLDQVVMDVCSSLGLSDFVETSDNGYALFVYVFDQLGWEYDDDIIRLALVLPEVDEVPYPRSKYMYYGNGTGAPGAWLRNRLIHAILGLIATHPNVTPLIKPFETPPSPFTLALCEEVLCAPADEIPAAARQWVMLHLGEAV